MECISEVAGLGNVPATSRSDRSDVLCLGDAGCTPIEPAGLSRACERKRIAGPITVTDFNRQAGQSSEVQ